MTEERFLVPFRDLRGRVLALDEQRESQLNKDLSLRYWGLLQNADAASFVLQAEQVFSFRTTRVEVEGRQVFKYTLWADSWTEFCLKYLKISIVAANQLKRIWEIFVLKCGFDLHDLARSGKMKLSTALATVDRQWPDVDEGLLRMLFGRPHRCQACDAYVAFEGQQLEQCPVCDEDYRGQPPATFAEVLAACQAIRSGLPPSEDRVSIEVTLQEGKIVILIMANVGGLSLALPAWEIGPEVLVEVEGHPGLWEPVVLDSSQQQALCRLMERRF